MSHHEQRTADRAAGQLRRYGFTVQAGIGGTGVAGLLSNGSGPTVLLRADMDALPVREDTGAGYASDRVIGELTLRACRENLRLAVLLCAKTGRIEGLAVTM